MDNNKNKESFLKGALILGAAGVVVKIMGAFFRIPLGNLIGSTGMGYYQAVYPVYTLFLTLATAGFPTALAKLVSEKGPLGILVVLLRHLKWHRPYYSLQGLFRSVYSILEPIL